MFCGRGRQQAGRETSAVIRVIAQTPTPAGKVGTGVCCCCNCSPDSCQQALLVDEGHHDDALPVGALALHVDLQQQDGRAQELGTLCWQRGLPAPAAPACGMLNSMPQLLLLPVELATQQQLPSSTTRGARGKAGLAWHCQARL
jgi:hypothetical protein